MLLLPVFPKPKFPLPVFPKPMLLLPVLPLPRFWLPKFLNRPGESGDSLI
ncbi:hypothetical protein X077_00616 [Mycobacterium tuberculosis BTB05-481]|nr:hypothetical protein X077_00616 [Mycobacterium tuberculosis BTB05-481]